MSIQQLKIDAERLFNASDPVGLPIPAARGMIAAGKRAAPTLNKALVAAVSGGVAAPDEKFAIGEGWSGEKHGELIAKAGEKLTGRALVRRALEAEVCLGMHGAGREWWGYGDAYMTAYLLAFRHTQLKLARDLVASELLIGYLLTVPGTFNVVEIGGRATGGVDIGSSLIREMWRRGPDAVPAINPERHNLTAARMFQNLTLGERRSLPDSPAGVEEVIRLLTEINPIIPARFNWWGYANQWTAQVNRPREWFIQKRTGERALIVSAERHGGVTTLPDKLRETAPYGHNLHLSIDEHGVTVHGPEGPRGGETKPSKPDPTPRPTPKPPVDPPPAPDPIPRWKVEHWLSKGGAPEGAIGPIAEIVWQAQQGTLATEAIRKLATSSSTVLPSPPPGG